MNPNNGKTAFSFIGSSTSIEAAIAELEGMKLDLQDMLHEIAEAEVKKTIGKLVGDESGQAFSAIESQTEVKKVLAAVKESAIREPMKIVEERLSLLKELLENSHATDSELS